LYGLFKFLTVSRTPNSPRPSLLDFTGKAKWDSWNDIGKKFADKDPAEAEERYIAIAKSLGWHQGSSSESKRASDDASCETGAGGMSLGISVSFIKPPEHHGEDIHSLAISGDVEKMKQLFDSDSIPNVDERDEYVSGAKYLMSHSSLNVVRVILHCS
jgi:acyl-CoA-binding protein